ncbi:MAG: hypothetical protein ABUK01_05475 [Leptospirales bacterium]
MKKKQAAVGFDLGANLDIGISPNANILIAQGVSDHVSLYAQVNIPSFAALLFMPEIGVLIGLLKENGPGFGLSITPKIHLVVSPFGVFVNPGMDLNLYWTQENGNYFYAGVNSYLKYYSYIGLIPHIGYTFTPKQMRIALEMQVNVGVGPYGAVATGAALYLSFTWLIQK